MITLSESAVRYEVNLGNTPRRDGRFVVAITALPVGKAILVSQANGPYTGKGTRSDEAEMDGVVATGRVATPTSVEVFWHSNTFVKGNFAFDMAVIG